MKAIYHPYTIWEDYLNGMYKIPAKPYSEKVINKCTNLLSNEEKFFQVGLEMVNLWSNAAGQNLTNKSVNRQSWVGQASCCYKYGASELITRISWSRVSSLNKIRANKIADKIISMYEAKNRKLYRGLEEKGLF